MSLQPEVGFEGETLRVNWTSGLECSFGYEGNQNARKTILCVSWVSAHASQAGSQRERTQEVHRKNTGRTQEPLGVEVYVLEDRTKSSTTVSLG